MLVKTCNKCFPPKHDYADISTRNSSRKVKSTKIADKKKVGTLH